MKLKFVLLLFPLLFSGVLESQCPASQIQHEMTGNQVKARILNGGDLFWDGDDGQFLVPVDAFDPDYPVSTIFAAALWMGGIDPGGNLKLAAQTYGRASNSFDYVTGPLHPTTGLSYGNEYCDFFNRIWVVNKEDILNHLSDFNDNGVIDNPVESIYSWPANDNFWSFLYNGLPLPDNPNGWAPFHDKDGDGKYEPELGEYPHPPHVIHNLHPQQITWSVFNDLDVHTQSYGNPIQAEVQLTTWNFDCFANHSLTHTVFTSHKIINRAVEPIDSFFVGLWVDFDLGCYLDDYMGSSPENNGFLVYNSDDLDGESSPTDCAGVNTYGYETPAQSVTFLNRKLDKFIYYNNGGGIGAPSHTNDPQNAAEFYNYLTGSWRDGTPLTQGGDGYNSGSTDYVDHAFPDNPNDPTGWSMFTEFMYNGDRRVIGSTKVGRLAPGEAVRLDMAFTYHGYSGLDFLESANQAYIEMAEMQHMYNMHFNGWCEGLVSGLSEVQEDDIRIFPNPSQNGFTVESKNDYIEQITIYNTVGKIVYQAIPEQEKSILINSSQLSAGIYYVKIKQKNLIITKNMVIQR